MKLKLSCADFTFPLMPHDKALSLISMLEIEGVDIGLFEGRQHLQPSKELVNIKKNAGELAKKLRDNGLIAADIFLQMATDFESAAPNHPNAKIRDKSREFFIKTLEYASECGCRHVTGLPGVYFEGEPKEASFGRCCEEMNWRCEIAEKYRIVFSVEAHVGSITPNPEEAMKLMKNTRGLTLTLDYSHFKKAGTPDSEIQPLLKHASHFHARGAAKGRVQTPVKESGIDFPEILKVMKDIGYSGFICLEYVWGEWEDCNRTDSISETILLRDLLLDSCKKL